MHASEDAEQLRGASERLRRALDGVAAAEAALDRARRELHAAQRAEYGWTDGLAGRRLVAEALAALVPHGWIFFDAVHWPGRPGVVVDHVGVGPGGVVVMFSRQWTGAVEVRGGVLRQNGVPRLREAAAVSAAAGAVCALLEPGHRSSVSAFVCAVQHDVRPATVAPGVNVVGVRDVARAVLALPERLSPAHVERVRATLRATLVGPQPPDQLTTRALTVYGEGPGLPWSARPDGSLFEQPEDGALSRDPADGLGGDLGGGLGGDLGGDAGRDLVPPVPPVPPRFPAADAGFAGADTVLPPGADVPFLPPRTVHAAGHHVGAHREGTVPGALRPGDERGRGPHAADLPVAAGAAEVVDGGGRAGLPVLRGRHRAPSRHSARTAHRTVRRDDVPVGWVVAAGCAAAGVLGVVGRIVGSLG